MAVLRHQKRGGSIGEQMLAMSSFLGGIAFLSQGYQKVLPRS